jgi:hypothetical protein
LKSLIWIWVTFLLPAILANSNNANKETLPSKCSTYASMPWECLSPSSMDQNFVLNSTVDSLWSYCPVVLAQCAKISKCCWLQVRKAPILNSANVHTSSFVNPSPWYIDQNHMLISTVNSLCPYLHVFLVKHAKISKCRRLQVGNTPIPTFHICSTMVWKRQLRYCSILDRLQI